MDSTRPIRALMRGLDTLCVLNAQDGASVAEVVHATRLPRTTVYRLLGTLCEAGYVQRDPQDERYRVTTQVRAVADSQDECALIVASAHEALRSRRESLGRPVAIATPAGTTMTIHEPRTPSRSVLRAYSVSRVPVLESACGIAYLSRCAAPVRETLIAAALRGMSRKGRSKAAPDEARLLVERASASGYATAPPGAVGHAFSVPVRDGDRVLAALTVDPGTIASNEATSGRFLAELQDCATQIVTEFLKNRVETRRTDTPETTD